MKSMIMKHTKLTVAAVAVAVLMVLTVIGVHASTITSSTPEVTLKDSASTATFDVVLTADKDFAGAEFGLKPSSEDVTLSSLTFSDALKDEAQVETDKNGTHYFGFFAGSNKYKAGDYTVATVTYNYTGDEEQTIRMSSSKIVTLDESGNTTTEDASEGFTVTLKRVKTPDVKVSKPGKVTKLKLKAKKKAIVVSYKKVSKASGYQIKYAKSKKFSKAKVKTVSSKVTKKTLTKLSKKKTYYVKVRAYKKVDGKKYYGSWSSVKKIKTK